MPAAPSHKTTAAGADMQHQALDVVRSWVDAFNRHDIDTSAQLAHPTVVVYPTPLFRHQDRYGGKQRSGEFLVTGEIVLHGQALSPIAGLVAVQDELVMSARSYLSDEQMMRDAGHIDR